MKQHPYIGKIIEIESDCELGKRYRNWTVCDVLYKKPYMIPLRYNNYNIAPDVLFRCINERGEFLFLREEFVKENGEMLSVSGKWLDECSYYGDICLREEEEENPDEYVIFNDNGEYDSFYFINGYKGISYLVGLGNDKCIQIDKYYDIEK